MSININAKPDYTSLFSSLNTSSSSSASGLTSLLSDYASIKNGSYSRLMKAYYAKNDTDSSSSSSSTTNKQNSISTAEDSAKVLSKVQSAADDLKESADALLENGTKKVFKDDSTTDSVYSAVNTFVNDYNSLISATADSTSSSITGRTTTLKNATAINEKSLAAIGITINKDNTLTLDKEAFLKSDISKVKSLFNGNSSYAYQTSVQASFIDFAATNEASKANTYTASGNYSNAYSAGDIYSSLF